jgi:hypothetical protein
METKPKESRTISDREGMLLYARSARFGILSWTSGVLTLAYFVFPQYGVRLLYVALAISIIAVLPLIPGLWRARNTKFDLHNRRDRNSTIVVLCYIGLPLAAAILFILYRRGR